MKQKVSTIPRHYSSLSSEDLELRGPLVKGAILGDYASAEKDGSLVTSRHSDHSEFFKTRTYSFLSGKDVLIAR